MKKWVGIISFLFVIGLIMGCSKTESKTANATEKQQDVLSLLSNYKKEQYTIEDPKTAPTGEEISKKVKEYLTEDALADLEANRNFQLAPDLAKNTNHSIELTGVEVKQKKENDDGTVIYTYTVYLKLTNVESSSSQEIEKKGEITVSNVDKLIITKDWQDKSTFEDHVF
ncbi:hypothetical protein [Bacillus weihaiensis]|uniref:hypothetical protein n=1 Tax=Bacillus weihaiensis TaxID=1547283 RepID=UPI00235272C9|nr:hypothetical protein [Bacillus weihaiensis]